MYAWTVVRLEVVKPLQCAHATGVAHYKHQYIVTYNQVMVYNIALCHMALQSVCYNIIKYLQVL